MWDTDLRRSLEIKRGSSLVFRVLAGDFGFPVQGLSVYAFTHKSSEHRVPNLECFMRFTCSFLVHVGYGDCMNPATLNPKSYLTPRC